MASEIGYYITMVSENIESVNLKESSANLPAHGCGEARASICPPSKNPPAHARTARQGGVQGGDAEPPEHKNGGQPRRLLGKSRAEQNTLFLN